MLEKTKGYLFILAIIVFLPIAIWCMYIFKNHQKFYRAGISKFYVWLFNIKIERKGEFDTTANMLIINHKSFLDVIYTEAVHPSNLCWIAKKELGEVPIYGHLMKAPKMILVDREDKKGLVYLLKEAKRALDDGRIITIFPEGTRAKDHKFLPFKAGAKIIAEKYNLKIQPVVLVNTREILDFDNKIMKKVKGSAIYMESFIPEKDTHWYEEIREKMEKVYQDELSYISSHR